MCDPCRRQKLTQMEHLVEQTLSLEQTEDEDAVDIADVFLKSCGNCSQVHICKSPFKLSESSFCRVKVKYRLNVN